MNEEERLQRLNEGLGRRRGANGANGSGFLLHWFRDVTPMLDAQDFVQGLLVSGSIITVYGAWGSGKTFWVTTLALHVAAGFPFAGRRVDQGGVVYCLMESGVGFQNRVALWRDEHGLGDYDLPFVAVTEHLNMLDPEANLDLFISACKAAAARMRVPLRLIVIDTLARALSGGNESAPEHMGALVMNADRLRRETGAAVLFVHHSGKDQARGARGHSSLSAAVDTEIEISASDGEHCATVLKQRDLDKGTAFGFTLRAVEMGRNPHGEPVTSCLVEFAGTASRPSAALQGHQKRAYEVLCDLIARVGQTGFSGAPPGIPSVPDTWWRQNFLERAMPGDKPDTKSKAFRRASKELVENHRVGMNSCRVWIVARTSVGHLPGHGRTNRTPDNTPHPDISDTPL